MRRSGILLPVFSLPSRFGIGTFGKSAYEFVDFLKAAGQKIWQVLPLGPIDEYNSPYMSPCVFAGNPLFIDYDELIKENLLNEDDLAAFDFGVDDTRVCYKKVKENSEKILKIAFLKFKPNEEYEDFLKENAFWLNDYAVFTNENGFCKFKQFIFFKQWYALKKYANQNGILIFGDMPIYPTLYGADVRFNPKIFKLNEDFSPKVVSGTPPDAFSKDGQLWGGPVYDFSYMKTQKVPYLFFVNRIKQALMMYDIIRLDHFRAFEAYYEIPVGSKNGKNGKWQKGPGMDLFNQLKKHLGDDLPIVAEDLGVITKEVKTLLKETGFAGMRVLQFAFDGDKNNPYLPFNYCKNTVAYIGTHDNNTVCGWFDGLSQEQKNTVLRYVGKGESIYWALIRLLMSSVADTCIFTMQDIMGLPEKDRINTPSSIKDNWTFRIQYGCANDWLANILREMTETYGR